MFKYPTDMPTAKTKPAATKKVIKTVAPRKPKAVAPPIAPEPFVRSVPQFSVVSPPIPERTMTRPSPEPLEHEVCDTDCRSGWRCKLLALAIFLFPFVAFPWTFSVHDFPKQLFLTLITSAGLIIVFATSKKTQNEQLGLFPRHLVLPFWLLTIVAAIVGALRSGMIAQSLIGYNGTESFSVLTLLLLGIWTMLVYHGARENSRLAYAALTASGSVLSLITIASLLGFNLYSFVGSAGFNPSGTTTTAGIIAGATILLALGGFFQASKKLERLLFLSALIAPLFLIAGIGLRAVWITLAIGLLVSLTHMYRRKLLPRASTAPLGLLLLLAIVFAVHPFISFLPTPLEVGPSHAETWNITKNTLAQHPLIGSGTGTFSGAYLKFRSLPILQTPFWNISFDWGSSAGLTALATLGLLGAGLLTLTILSLLGMYLWKLHREETSSTDWALAGAGVLLFVASWLAPMPLALSFFFVTLLGLMLARQNVQPLETSANKIGRSFSGALIILFALALIFIQGRRTLAETIAARTQVSSESDVSGAQVRLALASRIDPWNDAAMRMHTDLARLLLQQKLQTTPRADQQKILAEVRDLADNALKSAKAAVAIAPQNVLNWNALGGVYLDIAPFTAGAAEGALQAFSKAHDLSPSDPEILTNLGIAQSLSSQKSDSGTDANTTMQDTAQATLKKAAEIRPNFALAHLELARLLAQTNKTDDALAAYRRAQSFAPSNPALHYEIGLFLFQNKRGQEAQTELLAAIQLAPKFSNARWYLAQVYEDAGDTDKAIEQIQKVVELNPDNEQAKTRLSELQKPVKKGRRK